MEEEAVGVGDDGVPKGQHEELDILSLGWGTLRGYRTEDPHDGSTLNSISLAAVLRRDCRGRGWSREPG